MSDFLLHFLIDQRSVPAVLQSTLQGLLDRVERWPATDYGDVIIAPLLPCDPATRRLASGGRAAALSHHPPEHPEHTTSALRHLRLSASRLESIAGQVSA